MANCVNKQRKEYHLEADSELRFEIKTKDAKASIKLISGFAELFGTELVGMQDYEFEVGTNASIFTYHGCHLQITGNMDVCYVSTKTPMIQYINCHSALEQMRTEAEIHNKRGPITMIVGPKDVGKSTLCRLLLNYAVRSNRRPLYADIDVGQGELSIPGSITTSLINRTADIYEGFSKTVPLVYHYGHKSPSDNDVLYKTIISNIAKMTLQSLKANKRTKYSGIIINTCGWVNGAGYFYLKHAAAAYDVNKIFVLDQEILYNKLLIDMPSSVNVVLLQKSSGVINRSKRCRTELCHMRIKEYFFGFREPLIPFSISIKFSDLRLYKIGGVPKSTVKTKVYSIIPSPSLLYHLIAVSFANSIEDVISTNVAGFLCVTQVDMERQSITVLSPQPHLIPKNALLLLSDLQFVDN